MLSWYSRLTKDLIKVVQGDPFWESYLSQLNIGASPPFTLHLAVMVEPFLRFMLEGRKTVESRFSVKRSPPFNRVHRGDVIMLKKAGGPVVGICMASESWFYQLDSQSWTTIKQEFASYICAQDPKFWEEREGASFATLIKVTHVRNIQAIKVEKRDRRGWVVIPQASYGMTLPLWDDL
jgi:hypothetical protein